MAGPAMPTAEAALEAWTGALSRSAVYALLGRGLAYPTRERVGALAATAVPVLRALETGDAPVRRSLTAALDALNGPDVAGLQRAHVRIFSHVVTPDCPVYETAYLTADVFRQAHTMADVAGFYRAHGVEVGGPERERPDHIGPELEFMGLLARQEAEARASGADEAVETCRRTQALFLREHLGCWGPGLGRRIARLATTPLYRALGGLLDAWVAGEMRRLEVEPSRILDEPQAMPPMEDDECGAPAASGPVVVDLDSIR